MSPNTIRERTTNPTIDISSWYDIDGDAVTAEAFARNKYIPCGDVHIIGWSVNDTHGDHIAAEEALFGTARDETPDPRSHLGHLLGEHFVRACRSRHNRI